MATWRALAPFPSPLRRITFLSTLLIRYRSAGDEHLYAVSYGTQLILRTTQAATVQVTDIILDASTPRVS